MRDQNGHLKVGGWVLLSLGLLTFMLFAAGVGSLLERAFDPLFGRTYQFQSIGDVLHVHDPRYKVLSWDHAFLLLLGAFATGWMISRVNELLEWLEKSPEERLQSKQARKQRKVHSKTRSLPVSALRVSKGLSVKLQKSP